MIVLDTENMLPFPPGARLNRRRKCSCISSVTVVYMTPPVLFSLHFTLLLILLRPRYWLSSLCPSLGSFSLADVALRSVTCVVVDSTGRPSSDHSPSAGLPFSLSHRNLSRPCMGISLLLLPKPFSASFS